MRESVIEAYGTRRVEEEGGTHEKFSSPSRRFVPDRLVSLRRNRAAFAEYKATGEKPSAGQLRDHARRRARGFTVYVIDSFAGVDDMIAAEKKAVPCVS